MVMANSFSSTSKFSYIILEMFVMKKNNMVKRPYNRDKNNSLLTGEHNSDLLDFFIIEKMS
jgi:hypothetical protein